MTDEKSVASLVWVGSRCGIRSPASVPYEVGDREPCTECESPVDRACIAHVVTIDAIVERDAARVRRRRSRLTTPRR